VLRVDKEKGYIDLSKRRVSAEDITKCEERYMKSKTVASIMRHVASKVPSTSIDGSAEPPPVDLDPDQAEAASKAEADEKNIKKLRRAARKQAAATGAFPEGEDGVAVAAEETGGPTGSVGEEERLESLYEQIAWPLGKKYGHTYDAFKLALAEPETVVSSLPKPIPPSTLSILTATIARRLTPQAIKLRADIELTCYTPSGIDAIKKALKAGEKQSNDTVPIKAKLVAPPLYVLSTNATDKFAAVDRLEKAIESIQSAIEDLGGSLVVKMKPKAISESEEQDLAQLMAKAGEENAEVSGDEEEEDEGL